MYYNKRSSNENRESEIDEKLKNLEEADQKYEAQLEDITNSISEIKTIIENVQKNQNRANIATARSAMYRLANELISKNWMSQTEYDTLSELSEVYNMSGGPRHSKSSLIKRALNLPVLTDEEIQFKKYEDIKNQESIEDEETDE